MKKMRRTTKKTHQNQQQIRNQHTFGLVKAVNEEIERFVELRDNQLLEKVLEQLINLVFFQKLLN